MKYVFYSTICLFIFQNICSSQNNDLMRVQQHSQGSSSSQGGGLGLDDDAFQSGVSQFQHYLTERTRPMSSSGSLSRRSAMSRCFSADQKLFDQQTIFFNLDREISLFDRKVSEFRFYKNPEIGQIRQEFTPEFKLLCQKVRSFQDEQCIQSDLSQTESLDSSLVQALLVVAVREGLDKDTIPSPITCSLSRPIKSLEALSAESGQRNQLALVSEGSGVKRSIPPLNLKRLSDVKSQKSEKQESCPNNFPDIPFVVVECISDLEDCD